MAMPVPGKGSDGLHAPLSRPNVARIGIAHGEEGADALPVLLQRPIRCPARPESVALVRPAQPVVGGAAVSCSADGEPFAIDVEGEQHRPGPSPCSAVHRWNGGGTIAVTAGAPVHKSQHPRPPALSPSHTRSADALICRVADLGLAAGPGLPPGLLDPLRGQLDPALTARLASLRYHRRANDAARLAYRSCRVVRVVAAKVSQIGGHRRAPAWSCCQSALSSAYSTSPNWSPSIGYGQG